MSDPVVLYVNAGDAADGGATALEEAGFSTVRAVDAADALKRLDDGAVDCLVSEVALPDMAVGGFVSAVRATDPELPVFLVGEAGDADVGAALSAGADGHFDAVDGALPGRIERAVAERRTERALERHRRLKDAVREVAVSLADATTRNEVEAVLYHRLSTADLYRFVWTGGYDAESGVVRLRRPTRDEVDAEELAATIGSEDPGFIERAATDGEITAAAAVPDLRSASANARTSPLPGVPAEEPSITGIALPLVDGDVVYGIALLASDVPLDEAERTVLEGLSAVVGHALSTTEEVDADEGDRRFAERLAHELRNPLGIASTHLELGRENGDPESFDRVETALSDMERTIDGLVALAERDGIEGADTRPIAEDAEEAWEPLEAPDADLVVEGDLEIEADHDLAVRLFSNLFRNAIEQASTGTAGKRDERAPDREAASDGTPEDVTVRVGPLGNGAAEPGAPRGDGGSAVGFYVEDDGPGIPPEQRDTVFEWGFSTTDGAGIGLSLVSEIADLHGWEVDVTEGEDGGARFEIRGVETPADGSV